MKNKSTTDMTGIETINETSIETLRGETLVFFLVSPDNIAVLSESAVRTKVANMSSVIKSFDGIELSCINSRENFDSNKRFYKERLLEEKSEQVRILLQNDLAYLDRVQVQMSSAREFLFIVRTKESRDEEIQTVISRMEKLLKDNGFNGRLARKDDLKRILSVYFIQNITQVYFDDFDGEKYVKGDGY